MRYVSPECRADDSRSCSIGHDPWYVNEIHSLGCDVRRERDSKGRETCEGFRSYGTALRIPTADYLKRINALRPTLFSSIKYRFRHSGQSQSYRYLYIYNTTDACVIYPFKEQSFCLEPQNAKLSINQSIKY